MRGLHWRSRLDTVEDSQAVLHYRLHCNCAVIRSGAPVGFASLSLLLAIRQLHIWPTSNATLLMVFIVQRSTTLVLARGQHTLTFVDYERGLLSPVEQRPREYNSPPDVVRNWILDNKADLAKVDRILR